MEKSKRMARDALIEMGFEERDMYLAPPTSKPKFKRGAKKQTGRHSYFSAGSNDPFGFDVLASHDLFSYNVQATAGGHGSDRRRKVDKRCVHQKVNDVVDVWNYIFKDGELDHINVFRRRDVGVWFQLRKVKIPTRRELIDLSLERIVIMVGNERKELMVPVFDGKMWKPVSRKRAFSDEGTGNALVGSTVQGGSAGAGR